MLRLNILDSLSFYDDIYIIFFSFQLVCSSLSLPFPLSDDAFLSAMVQKDISEYYMTSISPFYNPESERTLYQSAVLRGVPNSKFLK